MTEPELRETQLSSREIFDGRILHVFEDTVRLPNGAAASREYLRHIGAVCVIPVLEDGSVLVERQYRYPVAQVLTEIPAGKLDAKDEDHLLAAQRELREETGAEATHWQPLGAVLPSPGCYGEVLHLYLARDLTFGATHPDADEFLQVRRLPFDTLLARCLSGEIEDGKTVAAVLKAKLLGL